MVRFSALLSAATVVAAGSFALAHSPLNHEFERNARRSLGSCSSQYSKRDGLADRAMIRRQSLADQIRKARGLPTGPLKRDLATVLATDHRSNLTGLTNNTDPATIFTNNTCVLAPEGEEGPYMVDGEYVRQDLRESQEGVPVYLDLQLVDVNTCEPVSDVYIDIWGCNATGVYAGGKVVAEGNGDSSDLSNINATFLRGLQQTDDEGVVQFITLFPGHYSGRTVHIHLVAHQPANGTLYDNGTYVGNVASHIGQMFFDQDLITQVEATYPYSLNTEDLTTNADDRVVATEADGGQDPVVEYVLLGDTLDEGIFAWTSVAINTTAIYDFTPAAWLYADGGVTVSSGDNSAGGGDISMSGVPTGSMSEVLPSSSVSV